MPRRKSYSIKRRVKRRRIAKRKPYGRRRRRLTRRGRAYIARAIMPDQKLVMFKYADFATITPDVSIQPVASQVWFANNCNDPYADIGGHQPYMWDQWGTFYNKFVVLGSKITVFPDSSDPLPGSTTQRPFRYWVALSDDGKTDQQFPHNSSNKLWEDPTPSGHRRSRIGYWGNDWQSQNAQQKSLRYVTMKFSAKKFFEITNVKDKLDELGCNIDTGAGPAQEPTKKAYFDVCAAPAGSSWGAGDADPGNLKIRVLIKYIVMLYDRASVITS